jgi:SpoVK/Ycf46/Vps4 family AAA+-type ATPase
MKNIVVKNNLSKKDKEVSHKQDVQLIIDKKIQIFRDVVQKTILHVQKSKVLDILGISEVNNCTHSLNTLNDKIINFTSNLNNITTDEVVISLQSINNDLSAILKNYGTENFEDLLLICFGNNSVVKNDNEMVKFDLLKKYFHPTGYKLINNKIDKTNSNTDKKINFIDDVSENKKNLDCLDISLHVKQFHLKVYGLKTYIINSEINKNLIIFGFVDDVNIKFMNNSYINEKLKIVTEHKLKNSEFDSQSFTSMFESLSLKDFLVMECQEVYNKYIGYLSNSKNLKQKNLSQMVKDFINSDLYGKRNTIIQFLLTSQNNYDSKYYAYLLYDLLSNDANNNIDTQEQIILFDSFPWSVKESFREAMKKTIQYTSDLLNFDMNKIPLEQQICLLKASDNVKEKAMIKLKEIKSKSEDSGSKARQYLDGLLKIPFNIYKKEPIMYLMDEIKQLFLNVVGNLNNNIIVPIKEKYTSIEIKKYIVSIKQKITEDLKENNCQNIKNDLTNFDKNDIINNIVKINAYIDANKLEINKIKYTSNKSKESLKSSIWIFVDSCLSSGVINDNFYIELLNSNNQIILKKIIHIEEMFKKINGYISNVKHTLNSSVHGHEKAKKQIERIIGQWINGQQDGYCFGFEGPPGLGKTTLAKYGLSNCLKDDDGNNRPFAMIQMGGDSNGSTLHGHNYTYVGSTWGGIVQILMDKKCMNPIIFIDEVDKISRTEHGKEIVGILTHLLDSTQNDCFQDKYFTGIDLDLSKALFILSYNDVDAIDKILLDRIHRIKFSNLTIEDKLVICNTHILPEVYKKMGLVDMIHINDETLKFIIENYTNEAGVRKLKEILFEIVGEINLDILKNTEIDYEFPIEINIEDVKMKYFKDKRENHVKKIHENSEVGVINCLWANNMGMGGILPTNIKFFPCDKYLDLKLTGLLDDMMKESMHIALTLAYNLTGEERKKQLREKYDGEYKYGLHIHSGDGSINKSGTSAGIAITICLYSLLNNIKIKNTFGVTGEANLDGSVNEIGALNYKFIGGIKAGVTSFIFPKENMKDYTDFMEKYKDNELIKGISFYPISHINEAFDLILEK